MADRIRIVNQALLLLAEKTIQSFDEDTPEARVATVMYEPSRNACLREVKPNFAIRRAAELPTAGTPAWGFAYALGLPQDCTLVLEVWSGSWPVRDWLVEGRTLLTGQRGALIRYISQRDDLEIDMDAAFEKLLAAYLAAEFTYTLTSAASKLAAMQLLYEGRKREAETQYGQERSTQRTTNDQLTIVR